MSVTFSKTLCYMGSMCLKVKTVPLKSCMTPIFTRSERVWTTILNGTELLRAMGKVSTFVERIRGRTDIAVTKKAGFTPYAHKSQVDFVIQIKTIRGFQSDGQCFRELIGLNVENLDTSSSVLLTNLA